MEKPKTITNYCEKCKAEREFRCYKTEKDQPIYCCTICAWSFFSEKRTPTK